MLPGGGCCTSICQVQSPSQEVCGHYFDKGETSVNTICCLDQMHCATHAFVFYMQMENVMLLPDLTSNLIMSFQCPAEFQEQIGRNVESSGGEQNVFPTKRGLVQLHKKVIIIFLI